METEPDRQSLLDSFGETLTFPTFSIRGIPGFDTKIILHGESSAYPVESQDFVFNASLLDVKTNGIDKNSQFTFSDGVYTYTFKMNRTPVFDLNGWAILNVNYVSKA